MEEDPSMSWPPFDDLYQPPSDNTATNEFDFHPTGPMDTGDDYLQAYQGTVYQNPNHMHSPLMPEEDRSTTTAVAVAATVAATSTATGNQPAWSSRNSFPCSYCVDPPTVCRSAMDLERHVKSVHKIYSVGSKYWVCPVAGCVRAHKIWPRLDNFTSHVERMHHDQDPRDIVDRAARVVTEGRANPQEREPSWRSH